MTSNDAPAPVPLNGETATTAIVPNETSSNSGNTSEAATAMATVTVTTTLTTVERLGEPQTPPNSAFAEDEVAALPLTEDEEDRMDEEEVLTESDSEEDEYEDALEDEPKNPSTSTLLDDDRCPCHEAFMEKVKEVKDDNPFGALCMLVDAIKRRTGKTKTIATSRRRDLSLMMRLIVCEFAGKETTLVMNGISTLQTITLENYCTYLTNSIMKAPRDFYWNFKVPFPDALGDMLVEIATQVLLRTVKTSALAFELASAFFDSDRRRAAVLLAINSVTRISEEQINNELIRLTTCLNWASIYKDKGLLNKIVIETLKKTKGSHFSRWKCAQSLLRYDKPSALMTMICCASLFETTHECDKWVQYVASQIEENVLRSISSWYLALPSNLRYHNDTTRARLLAFSFAKYLFIARIYEPAFKIAKMLFYPTYRPTDFVRWYIEAAFSLYGLPALEDILTQALEQQDLSKESWESMAAVANSKGSGLYEKLTERASKAQSRPEYEEAPEVRMISSFSRTRVTCRVVQE
eukprot:TRINITY_DN6676_c0_g2_i2.p1 TRINITY_DN6676_c0_g2~~TRINITY_DN6676_c0_g2_i2.p1  ORF type:complete len:524 (-),score=104.79 TRINITY_DN6676_c0_g2_i2:43-1614(-)